MNKIEADIRNELFSIVFNGKCPPTNLFADCRQCGWPQQVKSSNLGGLTFVVTFVV